MAIADSVALEMGGEVGQGIRWGVAGFARAQEIDRNVEGR